MLKSMSKSAGLISIGNRCVAVPSSFILPVTALSSDKAMERDGLLARIKQQEPFPYIFVHSVKGPGLTPEMLQGCIDSFERKTCAVGVELTLDGVVGYLRSKFQVEPSVIGGEPQYMGLSLLNAYLAYVQEKRFVQTT